MFYGANKFNQNISGWNVSNVTNMYGMFINAIKFNNGSFSIKWNISNVTYMAQMFNGASLFNQRLLNVAGDNDWDTSNVIEMYNVFSGASSFNQDISGWDVSNVTNMVGMFQNATSFNQNLASWDIQNIQIQTIDAGMNAMFDYSGLSTENWNNILNGWGSRSVNPNIYLGALTLEHTAAGQAGYNNLTNPPNNWIITEGNPPCYSKGTKILTNEGYVQIENLKPGDLVKTHLHGYRRIEHIGKGKFMNNPDNWSKCMYSLKSKNPEFEDLIVTGGHSILMDKPLKEYDNEIFDEFYNSTDCKIDNKYLHLAASSSLFEKILGTDIYEYYHFNLESEDNEDSRYGVWANGVLSESTFKKYVIKDLKLV